MERNMIMSYIDEVLDDCTNDEASSILEDVKDLIDERIEQCERGEYVTEN